MERKISTAVADYLLKFGALNIPGIGCISVKSNGGHVLISENLIAPMKKGISFSELSGDTSSLVDYIASRLSVSHKKAQLGLSKYAQRIINGLLNYDAAELPGIGMLKKVKETNNVELESSDRDFDVKNKYLPFLELVPLINQSTISVPTPVISNSVDRTVIEPQSTGTMLTAAMANSNIVEHNYAAYAVEDEGNDWWKPLLFALCFIGLLCIAGLLFKKCSTGANPIVTELDESGELNSNGESSNETPFIIENINNHPNFEAYASYLTPDVLDNGCVIILGSFKSARNVTRLKDELIRENLQPYSEIHGDFTRVGIIFDCQEYDLIDYIQEKRRTLEKYAWYLNPDMEVAY